VILFLADVRVKVNRKILLCKRSGGEAGDAPGLRFKYSFIDADLLACSLRSPCSPRRLELTAPLHFNWNARWTWIKNLIIRNTKSFVGPILDHFENSFGGTMQRSSCALNSKRHSELHALHLEIPVPKLSFNTLHLGARGA